MIQEWRREIDEIDARLLSLLNQRAAYARAIGQAKSREQLPIHCPEREQQILIRLGAQNHGPLDAAAVRRVFEAILAESRRLETAVAHAHQKRPSPYRRIAIIGVGLMGGSLGLAIKCGYSGVDVIGVDQEEATLRTALARGAIDRALPLTRAVSEAELICLAVPVKATHTLIEELVGLTHSATMVTDLGSTKAAVCRTARRFLPDNFVGGHPLAGSAKSGIAAADVSLFQGALWCLTPLREPEARTAQLKQFIEGLGSSVLYLEPERHDRLVAYISHLPQLLAVALAELADERSSDDVHYQTLAAGGFADMTRIAASPYGIWKDIFEDNAREVDEALAALIQRLQSFRRTLGNGGSLQNNFERAGAFRRSLRHSSPGKEKEDGANHSPSQMLLR